MGQLQAGGDQRFRRQSRLGLLSSDRKMKPAIPVIRGVAFDMDGLLFDTESIYWQVGQTVLSRRGFEFTRILQQKMMGRVGVAALTEMVRHHSLTDSPEQLLAESDEVYAQLIVGGVQPMPGIDRLMSVLRAKSIPFGVATSSQRKFAEQILGAMPWYDQLRFVLTGDDVVHGKPHPEIYQRAASALQIDTQLMLVLEDSANGCKSAVAAGATTIAVPNECTREHGFDGVFAVAESLDDPVILKLFESPAF